MVSPIKIGYGKLVTLNPKSGKIENQSKLRQVLHRAVSLGRPSSHQARVKAAADKALNSYLNKMADQYKTQFDQATLKKHLAAVRQDTQDYLHDHHLHWDARQVNNSLVAVLDSSKFTKIQKVQQFTADKIKLEQLLQQSRRDLDKAKELQKLAIAPEDRSWKASEDNQYRGLVNRYEELNKQLQDAIIIDKRTTEAIYNADNVVALELVDSSPVKSRYASLVNQFETLDNATIEYGRKVILQTAETKQALTQLLNDEGFKQQNLQKTATIFSTLGHKETPKNVKLVARTALTLLNQQATALASKLLVPIENNQLRSQG